MLTAIDHHPMHDHDEDGGDGSGGDEDGNGGHGNENHMVVNSQERHSQNVK